MYACVRTRAKAKTVKNTVDNLKSTVLSLKLGKVFWGYCVAKSKIPLYIVFFGVLKKILKKSKKNN